jgi:hypothetical protein
MACRVERQTAFLQGSSFSSAGYLSGAFTAFYSFDTTDIPLLLVLKDGRQDGGYLIPNTWLL